MNEEIKEMNFSEMLFNRDERLLDYITNLQKENERLNNIISKINKIIEDYYLYDYKDESIARLKALENINHEIYKLKELKEGKQ